MLRTGDENALSRYAWNWNALPGTTLEQGQPTGAGKSQAQNCGANWYSGGVTDGPYGCGGFEQMSVDYMKEPPGSTPKSFEGTKLTIISFNASHAEDGDKRPGIGHYPRPKVMDGLYEDQTMPLPRRNDPDQLVNIAALLPDTQTPAHASALKAMRERCDAIVSENGPSMKDLGALPGRKPKQERRRGDQGAS